MELSSSVLLEAISIALKLRALELDECAGTIVKNLHAPFSGDLINHLKQFDEMHQELLYFSYCLAEISLEKAGGRICDVTSLLDRCKLEKIRIHLCLLTSSAEVSARSALESS